LRGKYTRGHIPFRILNHDLNNLTVRIFEQLHWITYLVAYLELRAEKEKIDRAKREKHGEERRRLQAIRDQEEEQKKLEQHEKDLLLEHAAKWRQAQDLRLFIEEIESKCFEENSPDFREWIRWAKSVQEVIDPTSGGVIGYVNSHREMNTKAYKQLPSNV